MTSNELAKEVSRRLEKVSLRLAKKISIKLVRKILATVSEVVPEVLSAGEDVVIGEIGKIIPVVQEAREKYNIKTGQREMFPPKVFAKFQPFKRLRAKTNNEE